MKFISALVCTLAALPLFAQQKAEQAQSPYEKFGKITVEELQKKTYVIDSSANAVVLSDIGEAAIEGNNKGWFSIVSRRHKVVHILNKNGYDEATVEVHLYLDGSEEEELRDVRAVTYNLEGGKIVETRLDKGAIFKDKVDRNHVVKKFTMPNVKEGSIIEFQYEVVSDFIRTLDPWIFQDDVPVLWSEFRFSDPAFFNYAFVSHGYFPFYISEQKKRPESYNVRETRTTEATETYHLESQVTDYRWVMKDLPELKEESFTSSVKNHLARLDLLLASRNYPLSPHDYIGSWNGLAKELLEDEQFGRDLKANNGWLSDDMKTILKDAATEESKAQHIFSFVRDNFSCTAHSDLTLNASLKSIYKARKGTVADINLLLIAMLNNAGLQADPVVLSTRRNGYAIGAYPFINQYNYVIAKLDIGGQDYFLDASRSSLGFNKLTPDCYNGEGKVIAEEVGSVNFTADSVTERKVTMLNLNSFKADKSGWEGTMSQTPGYFESYEVRDQIKESGKDAFFKEIRKAYGTDAGDVKISAPAVDSLNQLDVPVTVRYDIAVPSSNEDILYLNPMFGEGYKNNPFKSADRFYPVEMPYASDEVYILNIAIPQGYTVDELPKPVRVKLDEKGSGYFEYMLSQSDNLISLRSRVRFGRTLFMPEEYDALREFFNLIVKKQSEQIVFKKKK